MKIPSEPTPQSSLGIAGRIAQTFIDSKLTLLIVIASLLLGMFAVVMLPREEEPQIKVPMVDVLVPCPAFTPRKWRNASRGRWKSCSGKFPAWNTSTPPPAKANRLVIVRFKVGENMESSLVKLNQKLQSNFDKIPHGVSHPLIKARTIDDVPILCLTIHSAHYDHLTLAPAGRANG